MRRAVVTFSAPPRTRRSSRRQRPGRSRSRGRRPRTPAASGSPRSRAAFAVVAAATVAAGTAQELGHARGRDRQVGRLVALPAPRLGREVRAVGLDDEPVERERPHDLGEPARARIRHRPRDRDEEPEVEAPARHGQVAREAVEDPAARGHVLGRAERRAGPRAPRGSGAARASRRSARGGAARPAPSAGRRAARGRDSSRARARRSRPPSAPGRARRSARAPPSSAVAASCGWMPTAA